MLSWSQYNEAIRSILRDTAANRMEKEVLIVLSLLFNQYHNFHCDFAAAFMHINSGLRLIEQWSENSLASSNSGSETIKSAIDLVKDHVEPVLVRLDVQGSFLVHSNKHAPPYHELRPSLLPTMPPEFDSFSQARQAFDFTANYMFYVLGYRPEDCDEKGKEVVKSKYEQWWIAFGALVGRTPVRLESDDDRAARLLRMYHNFALIVLDTHHDPDEMGFDDQTERFDIMVRQAQALVQLPRPPSEQPGQPFSFDTSIASPMNFVAARCRVPHIRLQAISILKNAIKSSWNCEHCALVAQYIMETEEKDLGPVLQCSQIPSEKRIRRLCTEISFEDGHIKVTYVQYPYSADMLINVAIIPLKNGFSALPTIEGAIEMPPIKSQQQPSPSSEGEPFESQSMDEKIGRS